MSSRGDRAARDDEDDKVRLRGRDVVPGERIRVWYKEEDVKVEYRGTVTRVRSAEGMRVWFDGCPMAEQEWVNNDDEWRFEDEETADDAEKTVLTDAEMEAQCEFHRIRLKLGKLRQTLPEASTLWQEEDAEDGDAAAKAQEGAPESAGLAVTSVFTLTAAGVSASESELPSGVPSSFPAFRAPRRAPGTLLAKYGKCEFSGLPAVYCDPLTRRRFGTLEAYAKVRAKYGHEGGAGGAGAGPTSPGRAAQGADGGYGRAAAERKTPGRTARGGPNR